MKLEHAMGVCISAAMLAAIPLQASADAVSVKKADLKWKDMGNGIQAAVVSGDMDKGPSRFYLKYPPGLVTPKHRHDADHYATVVSGEFTLTAAGKEQRLGPGSYFALTKKEAHVAKVEGKGEVLFFIQADGPWNVVMEK